MSGDKYSLAYRTTVWEVDDGWGWRVEIDTQNGRAESGLVPSRILAFYMIALRLAAIERGEWTEDPVRKNEARVRATES